MFRPNVDIMSPQWTNVVFHDRNQAYGAYQLRKDNAYNTNRALIIAAGIFVLAISIPTIINKIKGYIPESKEQYRVIPITNLPPPPIEQPKVIPVQPQQHQVVANHDMIRDFPPVVRPDAHEDPPTEAQLLKADPGPETLKGTDGAAPAIDERVGTVEKAGNPTEDDSKTIFVGVEVMPVYPGGDAAFNKFLSTHIRYPNVAKENGVQGRVFVSFVVEIDGSLTDMKIVRDPGSGLGEEAVRVLKTSQHWSPGVQNGKKVRVAYTVPVSFALSE